MAPRKKAGAVDHDARWRPDQKSTKKCGYAFRGRQCSRTGAHYCALRADRVIAFFAELLVHTRGPLARTAFLLEPWQEEEIIRPLFGEVVWSDDHKRYVRRYRIGYIIVARKNGKSELAAAIQLYMLVGDDEEAAEVYSAAKDTKQAGKVFEPAQRMVELSPVLTKRVRHYRNSRRLVDQKTASVYEILTADAKGELGHNPHCFNLDEILAMPDGSMWQTMTTATGARAQELLYATSTETNDSASFGAGMIDEAERVQEDPSRAPHVFTFVRKLPSTLDGLERLRRVFPGHPHLPVSIDPFDEDNWKWANPALDGFKSRDAMRRQAMEAKDSVEKENGFRQFQVNQRVQQINRFISLALWDENVGPELAPSPDWWRPKLARQSCYAGLDLSSKLDMTAWCLVFETGEVLWRFWVPESVVGLISAQTGGLFERWIRDGWVTVTDGDTIDYERIYSDIADDNEQFLIQRVVYDRWSGEPVRQRLELDTGLEFFESGTTYSHMSNPMNETIRLLMAGELAHGGNPVARWMADNLNAKRPTDDPDRVRPVKPDRALSGVRIDGMPALFFAIDCRQMTGRFQSAYADDNARVAVV